MLEVGDRVKVMNTALGGKQVEEGVATIRAKGSVDGQYLVEFDDEPGTAYPRFVQEENKVEEGGGE